MKPMMNATALLAVLALATACGGAGQQTASVTTTTHIEQLSQVDWVSMTAAPTAAKVNNNSLIMMR